MKAFARLEALRIAPVRIDHRASVDLARERTLTAYDASYLWLARKLGAPLETLDERLQIQASET